jgi:hypothetical protein
MRRLLPLALAGLAACAAPAPVPKQPPPAAPPPAPAAPRQASEASRALAKRYATMQANLLRDGLLRSDGGGPDTPFTDAMLARAFLSVAFFEEYAGGEITAQSHPGQVKLERWQGPIRLSLRTGPAMAPADAAALRATVGSYLARLSRLTGLSITLSETAPNFFLHVADVDERAALGPTLATEMPSLSPAQIQATTHLGAETFCQVLSQSDGTRITRALAVIPAEHPTLLLQACLHEELAQALGLPNDSNLARPSIFNDDQEFALLTRMDEAMLKMLYSPELQPGMTAEAATPIVQDLARRLIDANS